MKDTKISQTTFEIQKVVPEKTETIQYDYDFLLGQEQALLSELAIVRDLLSRADAVGVQSASVDKISTVSGSPVDINQ